MAAWLSDRWENVAGALSSSYVRSRDRANELHIDPARAYLLFEEIAQTEAQRLDAIDAVIVTMPNDMHLPAAKVFREAGFNVICESH